MNETRKTRRKIYQFVAISVVNIYMELQFHNRRLIENANIYKFSCANRAISGSKRLNE